MISDSEAYAQILQMALRMEERWCIVFPPAVRTEEQTKTIYQYRSLVEWAKSKMGEASSVGYIKMKGALPKEEVGISISCDVAEIERAMKELRWKLEKDTEEIFRKDFVS